jgi:brefeldin A-resistance guanine nucleotide exchange factor 1
MLPLWLQILDILDRMMNSGQSDSLEEAIPESLKNILLVMADGGYLVPPSQDPSKEEMWMETRKRLERFLPGLFVETFPDSGKEQPGSAALSPSQPTSDAVEKSEESALSPQETGSDTTEVTPSAVTHPASEQVVSS